MNNEIQSAMRQEGQQINNSEQQNMNMRLQASVHMVNH